MWSKRESGTKKETTRTTIWLWLTLPIAILISIATGSELLIDGLFQGDAATFVAQAMGQDIVTLAVALPALVVCGVLARRGSMRAWLVWLGVLVYLVYTYVIYAFQVRFNPLFLVYVVLLGCSLYALVGGLATTDFERIRARFTGRTPVKVTSVFLVTIVVLFYFSWLREVVPALMSGGVPKSVVDNGTPTNGVHVLDMAWMLPAMGLTAIWLWRKLALGYALAGVLLTFMSVLLLAIMAMAVSMSLYAQPVASGIAVVFGIVEAASLGMLFWYLKGLNER